MHPLAPGRLAALRHLLWGLPTEVPDAERAWAEALVPRPEPLLGLALTGLDPEWTEALAHAGVPLTPTGGLAFERVFQIAEVPAPCLGSGPLLIPPLGTFRTLTSLPLKPLRLSMAGLFGVRLQIATGVHCFLSRRQAVLLNMAKVPRSGFLHGPRRGMRAALALEAGEGQVVPL